MIKIQKYLLSRFADHYKSYWSNKYILSLQKQYVYSYFNTHTVSANFSCLYKIHISIIK